MKISLLGRGHSMLSVASAICQANVATEIALLGENHGLSQAPIQDLQEANALAGCDTTLTLSNDLAVLSDSQVVILLPPPRGTVLRSPRAYRTANTALVRQLTRSIKQYAPTAKVLVAIPPANFLAFLVYRELEADGRRVLGLSNGIANACLKRQLAAQLNVSVKDVTTLVIGNDDVTYPLPQYCRINGIPIDQLMSSEQICQLTEVVNQRQIGSASYSLSVWISQIVTAIALDKKRVMNVGSLIQASTSAVYLNVPSKIGADGVEALIQLELTEAQREQFTTLVAKSMAEQC